MVIIVLMTTLLAVSAVPDSCKPSRDINVHRGYLFDADPGWNPADALPKVDNAHAYVSGHGIYNYRSKHYENLLISVNGYTALLADPDEAIPPEAPEATTYVARDMINVFYADTDITGCDESEVYWRISEHEIDRNIFSEVIETVSYEKFYPDHVLIVTYHAVDSASDGCCVSTGPPHGPKTKGLNYYQMAIGSKDEGDGVFYSHSIFNYASIGWIDYRDDVGAAMAGFYSIRRGARYQFKGSFKQELQELVGFGWGWPTDGTYAFRVDVWGMKCRPVPGWFIYDWNHHKTNYEYIYPSCSFDDE